jgi:Ser/Thr protein kinase RdoA (MazF antagonist)
MRDVMEGWGKGPDGWGLIHSDLTLGDESNVLFLGGEARPIDFDDCGLGYWVYDLASSLCHWQQAQAWPAIRDAVLQGYAQVRPLPEKQLAQLDLFMAARHVSEILWGTDQAQFNPSFREELPGWTAWAAKHVALFLDSHG